MCHNDGVLLVAILGAVCSIPVFNPYSSPVTLISSLFRPQAQGPDSLSIIYLFFFPHPHIEIDQYTLVCPVSCTSCITLDHFFPLLSSSSTLEPI